MDKELPKKKKENFFSIDKIPEFYGKGIVLNFATRQRVYRPNAPW